MSARSLIVFAISAVVATAIGVFVINKIEPLRRIVYDA